MAEQCGGAEAVARHHAAGKLTIRERIDGLLDEKSFQEVGKLAGSAKYDDAGNLLAFMPSPYVAGIGKIDGRPVAVGGEDYTIKGGAGFGGARRKGGQGGFVEDLAHLYRIPLVNLIDGVGGSVTSISRRGHATFPGSGPDGFEPRPGPGCQRQGGGKRGRCGGPDVLGGLAGDFSPPAGRSAGAGGGVGRGGVKGAPGQAQTTAQECSRAENDKTRMANDESMTEDPKPNPEVPAMVQRGTGIFRALGIPSSFLILVSSFSASGPHSLPLANTRGT